MSAQTLQAMLSAVNVVMLPIIVFLVARIGWRLYRIKRGLEMLRAQLDR